MAAVTTSAATTHPALLAQNPGGQFCRDVPRTRTAALFRTAVTATSFDSLRESVHPNSVTRPRDREGHSIGALLRGHDPSPSVDEYRLPVG